MRDYGTIYSSFWTSQTLKGLSDRGKLLAAYLLSSPHTNMIGCFRLPDGYVKDDLEWGSETVSKGFQELFQKGFATRDDGSKWVFIYQFLKWNRIENPNQGKAALKLFRLVPSTFAAKSDLARSLLSQDGKIPVEELEPFANGSETVSEPGTGSGTETGTNRARVFVPPTVEEVTAYVETRKKKIDPAQFVDYYTANGWVQGKRGKPVVDWQACVRTWEKNNFSTNGSQAPKPSMSDPYKFA